MATGGYVYLIRDIKTGLHKIGRSVDPEGRLAELGGKLLPLTLVHTVACDDNRAAERYLHTAFAAARVRDEWFRLDPADVELILGVARVSNDGDWPAAIRERFEAVESGNAPGRPLTPRERVYLPEDWLAVARGLAVERPMPVVWLLVELVKREAEAKGRKELPPLPWVTPKD